jgi:hypothetical protein
LFLGTYSSSAAVSLATADADQVYERRVFEWGLRSSKREGAIPPVLRRLFAAWLQTRAEPGAAQMGLIDAVSFKIANAAPLARTMAADAALAPSVKGSALLALGRFGTHADLPLLEKAATDTRTFHVTTWPEKYLNKDKAIALVSDAAVAAMLCLRGQPLDDLGFPLVRKFKDVDHYPDVVADYNLLGFFDHKTRQAAHKKAKAWLNKQAQPGPKVMAPDKPRPELKNEKPVPTAWGKPLTGLQLEVVIRNVGQREIEFLHVKPMGFYGPCADGKVSARGYPIPNQLSLLGGIQMFTKLAPGEAYVMGNMYIHRPGDDARVVQLHPGGYQIRAERIQVALPTNLMDIFELDTGYLDVEIPPVK